MALAAPTVYRLWLQGEKLQFQPYVYAFIAGSIVLNSIWSVSYIVPMSINKGSRLGTIVFTFQAFMLVAVFLASRQWGLEGAAVAWFINELILCLYITSRAFRVIDESPLEFWRALLSPGAFLASLKNLRDRRSPEAPTVDDAD
jgi:O-antigen/teichoic acid export membrane protein